MRRRRRRASPSAAAISGGSSSVSTSSRSAHAGIVLRCSSRPVCIAGEMSGAVSRASTALSTARPKPSRRSMLTLSWGDGPRSPETWTSTAGRPLASSTPCSPTARGKTRWASCPSVLGAPGSMPTSSVIASATVRWSSSGAEPRAVGEGHDERRARVIARKVARGRSPRRTVRDHRLRRRCPRSPIGRPRAAPPPRRRRCLRSSTPGRSCAWSRAPRTRVQAPAAPPCPTVRPATPARRRRDARGSGSAWRWSSPGAARRRSSASVRRRSSGLGSGSVRTEKPPPAVPPSPSSLPATYPASSSIAPAARAPLREARRPGSSVRRTRARLRTHRGRASR